LPAQCISPQSPLGKQRIHIFAGNTRCPSDRQEVTVVASSATKGNVDIDADRSSRSTHA
jgi:hypothetical protein